MVVLGTTHRQIRTVDMEHCHVEKNLETDHPEELQHIPQNWMTVTNESSSFPHSPQPINTPTKSKPSFSFREPL
jgi:hypothetical protein